MPGNREGDYLRKNAFLLYDFWPRHSTGKPTPGVMKFKILVDPSLVIITTYLVCLINAWE